MEEYMEKNTKILNFFLIFCGIFVRSQFFWTYYI